MKIVVNWPSVLCGLTIAIVCICGFLGFWYSELPDFTNPSKVNFFIIIIIILMKNKADFNFCAILRVSLQKAQH